MDARARVAELGRPPLDLLEKPFDDARALRRDTKVDVHDLTLGAGGGDVRIAHDPPTLHGEEHVAGGIEILELEPSLHAFRRLVRGTTRGDGVGVENLRDPRGILAASVRGRRPQPAARSSFCQTSACQRTCMPARS
jgi:hypothetical protein